MTEPLLAVSHHCYLKLLTYKTSITGYNVKSYLTDTGVIAGGSDQWLASLVMKTTAKMLSLPPPRRLCFRRCLYVCLLATLRKNFRTDLHEILREVWQLASEQTVKFW